jgi:hypothetical protein
LQEERREEDIEYTTKTFFHFFLFVKNPIGYYFVWYLVIDFGFGIICSVVLSVTL